MSNKKEYMKEYREKNKERYKAYMTEYYKSDRYKAAKKEYHKEYDQTEERKAVLKEYRSQDKYKNYQKEYNKEYQKEYEKSETRQAYNNSDARKASRKVSNKKYRSSEEHQVATKAYYDSDEGRAYFRNCELKRKYGISLADKRKMIESQNNLCAICNKPFSSSKDTHVDHNHTTNRVRDILCRKCNFIVGLANDDISIAESLVLYLKKHKEPAK